MAPLAGALHSSEPSTVWNIMILEGTDGAEPMALFRISGGHWGHHAALAASRWAWKRKTTMASMTPQMSLTPPWFLDTSIRQKVTSSCTSVNPLVHVNRVRWSAPCHRGPLHAADSARHASARTPRHLHPPPPRDMTECHNDMIIKHLKLATKEKTSITCVSQEKMHVQTKGVVAPPHPALMDLLQGFGDEIRLLLERLQQSKSSNEVQFEALTTAVTMRFDKIEKLISSTSMAQDQPTFGTYAKKIFSTPPSLTPTPAYDDAKASVLIVDQGIIAPDPVSVVSTTSLLSPTSLIKNIKCRDDRQPGIYDQSPFRRLDKATKKLTSFQREKGKKAMSKLLRFYKQWTCKSEASERQRALVEAFLAEERYVDHKFLLSSVDVRTDVLLVSEEQRKEEANAGKRREGNLGSRHLKWDLTMSL
ncbi:hypothetical protein Taro_024023 [Colocasia esculenta]|uniref:Uncharacterized protein n=1 Tax=Colocasia esculenta TaxID=4460 RepID=A0A843VJ38_COLES|nr:hypothetical protein [Colocasia esculenta]